MRNSADSAAAFVALSFRGTASEIFGRALCKPRIERMAGTSIIRDRASRSSSTGLAMAGKPFVDDTLTAASTGTGDEERSGDAPLERVDGVSSRYEIVAEHGRGGIGRVMRAIDHDLGREVAIKELLERNFRTEARFLREALITARLEHPSIVPVHEAGRWPDGTPYYAMKLIAGRSLAELISAANSPSERLALVPHVAAVADAIAYAHSVGIVHRDLKPSNIVVGEFGETIVIDWGVAKDLRSIEASQTPDEVDAIYRHAADAALTRAGAVVGTPAYMAPEQARGETVDERVDVHALGVLLSEICDGVDRVDSDLAAIVRKATAPEKSTRYRNGAALASDLRAFVSGGRIGARQYSLGALLSHWVRRHKGIAATVAIATILAVIGGTVYIRAIARARDHAETEKSRADTERDRAQLAQANLLVDRDPTRARRLLASMEARTPLYALLHGRATRGAAISIMSTTHRIGSMRRAEGTGEVAVMSTYGEFDLLDPWTGDLRPIDRDLGGPPVHADGGWVYPQARTGVPVVVKASPPRDPLPAGSLLALPTSKLLYATGTVFALEPSGELYRLGADGPILVESGVRARVVSDQISVTCYLDGRLIVTGKGIPSVTSRCAANESSAAIAASGTHWAALRDTQTLEVDGRAIHLPKAIEGEYEISISDAGLVAFADYGDKGWMIRPGSTSLEPSPHSARPFVARAFNGIAAWGYTDGRVVAVDATTDDRWTYVGHSEAVGQLELVVRDGRRRMVTSAGREIRIWELSPKGVVRTSLGCSPFHVLATADAMASDCSDGTVRVWSRKAGTNRVLHRHTDLAYGIVSSGGQICSAGWDGRVLCSTPSGDLTTGVLEGHGRVRWILECPGHDCLLVATDDNQIWMSNDLTAPLFAHAATPYQGAVTDAGLLASVSFDGSLIIYDLVAHRELLRTKAHEGTVPGLEWSGGGRLWTAGEDGYVKQWRVTPSAALVSTHRVDGTLSRFRLLPTGRAAVVDEQVLVIDTGEGHGIRLDLGRRIRDLTISADGSRVAAVAAEEVVVVDLVHGAVAAIDGNVGDLACVHFDTLDALILCGRGATAMVAATPDRFAEFGTSDTNNERNAQ